MVWGSLSQKGCRASRPQAARAQSRSDLARDSTLEAAMGAQRGSRRVHRTSCLHQTRQAPAVVWRLPPRQCLPRTSRGLWHPLRMMNTQQELVALEGPLLQQPLPPVWTLRPWTTLAGLRHTPLLPLLRQSSWELRRLAAVSSTLLI